MSDGQKCWKHWHCKRLMSIKAAKGKISTMQLRRCWWMWADLHSVQREEERWATSLSPIEWISGFGLSALTKWPIRTNCRGGLSDDTPPSSTPRAVWDNFGESRTSRSMMQKNLLAKETQLGNESYPAHQRKRKKKDMKAGEQGAAGNHSLGGKRIKVAVGEGWHCYIYPHFRSAAVILQSVCETFLHSSAARKHPDSLGIFLMMMMSSRAAESASYLLPRWGDMVAEWAAECLISSSALLTGKLPVSCWCVSVQRFRIMQKRLTLPIAITPLQLGTELHTPSDRLNQCTHTLKSSIVMSQRARTPLPGWAGLFKLEFWPVGSVHGDTEARLKYFSLT